ncbi:response regulator [Nitrospira sp. Kam-Ns4a]
MRVIGLSDHIRTRRFHNQYTTILVVDDEPGVRSLIAATLRRQGYTVLEASDGLEAYTLFTQRPSSIDLIITDLRMPRMTGFDLLQAVRATPSITPPRPPTPVLLVSGTAPPALCGPIASLGVPFLPKPRESPGAPADRLRRARLRAGTPPLAPATLLPPAPQARGLTLPLFVPSSGSPTGCQAVIQA